MTFPFDQTYTPPAPVINIRLSTPEWDLSTESVQALIDTGADGTVIPMRYLHEIRAAIGDYGGMRSQWGEVRTVNLYLVDIEIPFGILPGIWVVGDSRGNEIILGRNVLNLLHFDINGPAQTITMIG